MKLGFIGLGKMGSRMARKLLVEGHDVIVWNRSPEPIEALKSHVPDLKFTESIEKLVGSLEKPRVVWLMLPTGEPTETVLSEVLKYVEKDDIVIDGANAKFTDTEKHSQDLNDLGLKFLGIGVSGGVVAEKTGYPMMVGGDKEAYEYISPILDSLATSHGGHEYFGTGGAGHYVKMVHNAIEYGYMQSIGEGFGVMEKSSYNLDLLKVAKLYDKGSLISGFMMQRTIEALENDPHLDTFAGVIGTASGETVWTVEEAKKSDVPIEIIERSLEIRKESETDTRIQNSFAAKMVAALRSAFGGHPVKKK
ncbi:MAG TPA: NADP-dependent phosphogluconate dehydrogenase [Candidatus Limnocylindrales bacterium]|nr:NADP-dependent phosphogluconate dehydrogenase [Candidatus Limnocylindrales bacterium]